MKCPLCNHQESKVVETRESTDSTRRRRECLGCNDRFTTYERVERDLLVIKKDGRKEKFSEAKILSGVSKACQKRPVTEEQIDEVVKAISLKLKENGKEVQSQIIGEAVLSELATLDEVAYMRFASVCKEFKDSDSFAEELDRLKERRQEEEGLVRCKP